MNQKMLWRVAVIVSLVATVVVNAMANILPLNGVTTGELSDRFEVFFVPAGYVFSIWSVIYIGLLAYAIYQVLPAQANNPRLSAIAPLFVFSSAANVAWLFLWHYQQYPLTLLAMVALLLSLIAIYLRLGTGATAVSTAETWLVRVPFSIYLGWVSVATIVNVTVLLAYLNWGGWGLSEATWAVIMLAVGVVLAGLIGYTRRDAAYLAVLVWAFAGIGVKHADNNVVSTAAWVAAVLVGLVLLGTLWMGTQRPLPQASAV